MAVTYNTANATIGRIFTTTGGGVTFSADQKANTAFDYFADTAVINDAIYIGVIASGMGGSNNQHFSDVTFTIGTALVGATIVWEYYNGTAWTAVVNYQDDTVGFTATGVKVFHWGMQPLQEQATVNSVLASWLRARISAVTYVTSAAVFTGPGLNDGTSSGAYTGTGNSAVYEVEIDGTGTPDTFKWKKDGGAYTTGVAITGAAQTLSNGVKITFAATTGHTLADKWVITVTSVTEGGANATTVISAKDGIVNIDGFTDGSPCTLANIKTVLDSSPWLKATKTLNNYDFTSVRLYANSRLFVTKESFEIGVGGASPGYSYLNYLTMGVKIDNYFGRDGGTMWVRAVANSYPFHFTANTKIYGSNIIGVGTSVNVGPGYPNIVGEFIDTNFDNINCSHSSGGSFRNCRFTDPSVWLINTFPTVFERNSVLLLSNYLGYCYRDGANIPDLSFTAVGNYNLLYFNQTQNNPTYNFINPTPALPAIASANHVVARRTGTPNLSFTKVFFYDASAATYTDYTTEFNDATTGNAPIHGDVGDYYLFGTSTTYIQCLHYLIRTSLASNDYVYAWEYLRSGNWYAISPINDRTANFTVDNENIYGGLDGQTNFPAQTLTTINGQSAYWVRLRITTKGTGTPMIDRVYHYGDAETGCGSWNVYEKFTVDIALKDKSNVAIPTANVRIDLDGTNIYSGAMSAGGLMTQQTLTSRRWYFDPINAWTNWHQIAEIVNNPYDITISKDGYETLKFKLLMVQKENLTLKMNRSLSLGRNQMGTEFQ